MSDYLRECLDRHGDVTRALYGRAQDLREVERRSSRIIETGRLTYDDVETITHAGLWRGGAFWQWPTRAEFDERCEDGAVEGLAILPRREKAAVDRLLEVFRHIEPVSVVLRFVDPRNFGILSPPVEKLLEMGPAHKPREKYRRYVKDLRTLRDERGFATAAEVDMALWVLREVVDAEHARSEWLERAVPEYRRWNPRVLGRPDAARDSRAQSHRVAVRHDDDGRARRSAGPAAPRTHQAGPDRAGGPGCGHRVRARRDAACCNPIARAR